MKAILQKLTVKEINLHVITFWVTLLFSIVFFSYAIYLHFNI